MVLHSIMWMPAVLVAKCVLLLGVCDARAAITTEAPAINIESLLRPVDPDEADALLKFVLTEIQRLKVDNKELDECHGLQVGNVVTEDKKVENGIKHHMTLKIQPTLIVTESCSHQNSTTVALQPEVCEAEVWESNEEGHHQMALLRSTCLQVEELVE